jgi:hypothetical protein
LVVCCEKTTTKESSKMQRFNVPYQSTPIFNRVFVCIGLLISLVACGGPEEPGEPISCCGNYNVGPVAEQTDQTMEDWTAVYSTDGGVMDSVVVRLRPDGYAVVGRDGWLGLSNTDDFPAIVRKLSSEEVDVIQSVDLIALSNQSVGVQRSGDSNASGVNLYWADAEDAMWHIRDANATRSIFNVFESLMASIASDYENDPSGCLVSMGQMEIVVLEEGAEFPANVDDLAALDIEGSDPFIVIVPDTESEDGFQAGHLSPNHFGSTLGQLPVIFKSILDLPWDEPPANEVLVDFNEEVTQNVCGTFTDGLLSDQDLLTVFYSPLNFVNGIPGAETPVYRAVALLQND